MVGFTDPREIDPEHMSVLQIRKYAATPLGFQDVIDRVNSIFYNASSPPWHGWTAPIIQEHSSCQAASIINGTRFFQKALGFPEWSPSSDEIMALRAAATPSFESEPTRDAGLIANLLIDRKLLERAELQQHPIHAAQAMAGGGFAVMTHRGFAAAIVPNLWKVPYDEEIPPLMAISPYGDGYAPFGAEDFCQATLDFNEIFLVCKPNIPTGSQTH